MRRVSSSLGGQLAARTWWAHAARRRDFRQLASEVAGRPANAWDLQLRLHRCRCATVPAWPAGLHAVRRSPPSWSSTEAIPVSVAAPQLDLRTFETAPPGRGSMLVIRPVGAAASFGWAVVPGVASIFRATRTPVGAGACRTGAQKWSAQHNGRRLTLLRAALHRPRPKSVWRSVRKQCALSGLPETRRPGGNGGSSARSSAGGKKDFRHHETGLKRRREGWRSPPQAGEAAEESAGGSSDIRRTSLEAGGTEFHGSVDGHPRQSLFRLRRATTVDRLEVCFRVSASNLLHDTRLAAATIHAQYDRTCRIWRRHRRMFLRSSRTGKLRPSDRPGGRLTSAGRLGAAEAGSSRAPGLRALCHTIWPDCSSTSFQSRVHRHVREAAWSSCWSHRKWVLLRRARPSIDRALPCRPGGRHPPMLWKSALIWLAGLPRADRARNERVG